MTLPTELNVKLLGAPMVSSKIVKGAEKMAPKNNGNIANTNGLMCLN